MLEIGKYFEKTQKDLIFGKFAKDRTMLATVGDLGLALTGADLPADIRDLEQIFIIGNGHGNMQEKQH